MHSLAHAPQDFACSRMQVLEVASSHSQRWHMMRDMTADTSISKVLVQHALLEQHVLWTSRRASQHSCSA